MTHAAVDVESLSVSITGSFLGYALKPLLWIAQNQLRTALVRQAIHSTQIGKAIITEESVLWRSYTQYLVAFHAVLKVQSAK